VLTLARKDTNVSPDYRDEDIMRFFAESEIVQCLIEMLNRHRFYDSGLAAYIHPPLWWNALHIPLKDSY
jgi:hypothetical protein